MRARLAPRYHTVPKRTGAVYHFPLRFLDGF
jgi:hypothetical protein